MQCKGTQILRYAALQLTAVLQSQGQSQTTPVQSSQTQQAPAAVCTICQSQGRHSVHYLSCSNCQMIAVGDYSSIKRTHSCWYVSAAASAVPCSSGVVCVCLARVLPKPGACTGLHEAAVGLQRDLVSSTECLHSKSIAASCHHTSCMLRACIRPEASLRFEPLSSP